MTKGNNISPQFSKASEEITMDNNNFVNIANNKNAKATHISPQGLTWLLYGKYVFLILKLFLLYKIFKIFFAKILLQINQMRVI